MPTSGWRRGARAPSSSERHELFEDRSASAPATPLDPILHLPLVSHPVARPAGLPCDGQSRQRRQRQSSSKRHSSGSGTSATLSLTLILAKNHRRSPPPPPPPASSPPPRAGRLARRGREERHDSDVANRSRSSRYTELSLQRRRGSPECAAAAAAAADNQRFSACALVRVVV